MKDFHKRVWEGKVITGVFDKATTLKGAKEVMERVHFIGFANEKAYKPGSFGEALQLVANPYLFGSEAEAKSAFETWPLKATAILNL